MILVTLVHQKEHENHVKFQIQHYIEFMLEFFFPPDSPGFPFLEWFLLRIPHWDEDLPEASCWAKKMSQDVEEPVWVLYVLWYGCFQK